MNKVLCFIGAMALALSTTTQAYYPAVEHAANFSSVSLKSVWHKPSQNGDVFLPINLTVPPSSAVGILFQDDEYDLDIAFKYTFRVPETDAWFVLDWLDTSSRVQSQSVQTTGLPDNIVLPNGLAFPPPLGPLVPGPNTAFNGNLRYDQKVLNIGLQYLVACCENTYDFTWGAYLQWARLKRDQIFSYVDPAAPNDTPKLSAVEKSEGGGPFFDLTVRAYPWGKSGRCYSVFGHAGIAFLQMDNHYTFIRELNNNKLLEMAPDSHGAHINKIIADIGVAYDHRFRGINHWRLGLALSINYTNYINLFKNGSSAADFTYDYGTWAPTFTVTIGGVES